MTNFPDFIPHGYQIIEQLGCNPQGGRVTYKAIESNTQDFVVIKQFKFITSQDWDGYKAIEREINVLKGLNHLGIPRYLTSFDPGDGLCLVQKYINAQPLSVPRSFAPEEVKEIAIQLLEILIYLQHRIPPIIHRDIKPENVLIDEQLKVYLVDFGCARIGSGEVTALSSMVAGTTGFMPPEQLLNRSLTEASDLYGLGATLICLLTQTKSIDLNSLVDSSFRINFKPRLPKLSLRFVEWLEKMVQPDINQRFRNAKEALNALTPLNLIRIPEVKFSQTELRFKASRLGETITQTITLTNSIPETALEGKWSVKPHPKDPPHTPDSHGWIAFRPQQFKGNQIACKVMVDTSKLMANKIYRREIILFTNSELQKHLLNFKVQTAPFPIKNAEKAPPYLNLLIVFFGCVIFGVALSKNVISYAILSIVLGVISGVITIKIADIILSAIFNERIDARTGAIAGAIVGAILGEIVWVHINLSQDVYIEDIFFIILGTIISAFVGGSVCGIVGRIVGTIWRMIADLVDLFLGEYRERNAYFSLFITIIIGITTGVGAVIGWTNPYILSLLTATGLPLSVMLIYPPLQQARLKAQYRKRENQHLIEP